MNSCIALLLALIVLGCNPAAEPVVLDWRSLPYIEDEPEGRRLAGLEARLERAGERAGLTLTVAADGREVDPISGFQGARGSNRITARELGRIAREQRLEVRTSARGDSGDPVAGHYRVTRTGRLPERRLRPDGVIELEAESAEEFALQLTVEAGLIGSGEWITELVLAGRPRLRVRYTFDGVEGRIEEIECRPIPVPEELHP